MITIKEGKIEKKEEEPRVTGIEHFDMLIPENIETFAGPQFDKGTARVEFPKDLYFSSSNVPTWVEVNPELEDVEFVFDGEEDFREKLKTFYRVYSDALANKLASQGFSAEDVKAESSTFNMSLDVTAWKEGIEPGTDPNKDMENPHDDHYYRNFGA